MDREHPKSCLTRGQPLDYRLLITGSWLGFALTELLFPIWLGLAIAQFWYDRRRGWLALAFSSYVVLPVIMTLLAFGGYFTGSVHLLGTGYMRPPYDLHPVYRCKASSIGCLGTGYFWTALPNNLVIEGMTGLLGPVKRNYHGPYPSDHEAWTTLDTLGKTISPANFETGTVELSDGRSIAVDPGLIPSRWCIYEAENIRIALYEEKCLLVEARRGDNATTIMIDRSTGKPFTRCNRSIDPLPHNDLPGNQ